MRADELRPGMEFIDPMLRRWRVLFRDHRGDLGIERVTADPVRWEKRMLQLEAFSRCGIWRSADGEEIHPAELHDWAGTDWVQWDGPEKGA
jgi:hypothetical protein